MKKNIVYLLIGILTFTSDILSAQKTIESTTNKEIDSLLQVLETLPPRSPELKPTIEGESIGLRADTLKINTLNELSGQYLDIGNYDLALKYGQQAQHLGEKLIPIYKDSTGGFLIKKGIAKSYIIIGIVYWSLGNYESAMNNYSMSLKINEEIGNKYGIASCYGNIGLVYYDLGNYENAMDNHLKSLKINEEIGNKIGIASCYTNIGIIYYDQSNYKKSLEFYFKALKMREAIGKKYSLAGCLSNIGLIYSDQGNYPMALDYYLQSLKIKEEIGDKRGIAGIYNNIGEIYFKQTDSDSAKTGFKNGYQKALDMFLKSLKINREIGNIQGITLDYNNIANVYTKQSKFKESYEHVLKSLSLSKEIGYKEGVRIAYFSLSYLFEKKGDYKKAFEYQKLFSEIKDSLLNEESGKQMAEMNSRYDSEKKDKEIELLNKDKENRANLSDVEHRKQQVILFSVSGFSLLLLGFAMLIYRSFRQKKLLNRELEKLSIVASETDNGVLICGPKGELEWANAGLTRLLGYSFEELKQIGNTLEEVSSNPEIKLLIHQSIENKKSAVYQALNITKDGTERWMQSTLTPILDEMGNIKKLVVIDTDISERKKIEEKLSEQNTELGARTKEIEKQKELVEEKNLKIIDSITYARLIQRSILMEEIEIQQYLPDSFIFYQPKDIVSGDFYWFSKVDHVLILAAIDCTGHGVPGAFMSMIGNTLLNQIVNEKRNSKPSEILRLLNIGIYEALHQQKGGVLSYDGMDIALCSIDYKNNEIQYAGAQNPLYIVWENNIEVIKADMRTIGGAGMTAAFDPLKRDYTNHVVSIKKDMSIYLFSDGYMDQFGGQDRKKFGIQQFKNLLLMNQELNMSQQKEKMAMAFEDWRGITPQIDDVLVMGLRV